MHEELNHLVRLDGSRPSDGSRAAKQARMLFGLEAEALSACMVEAGEAAWRGSQLAEAMYRQWITALGEITTLSLPLRQRLAYEGWQVGRPAITQVFQSADGTERYLIQGQSEDALTVETVWMPEETAAKRVTAAREKTR